MEFKPRWAMPEPGNKFFTHYTAGGINSCIKVDGNSCLPNCVGYAHGRLLEIEGYENQTWNVPACNAEDWYAKAKSLGYEVGSEPKLGAVMVWSVGKFNNGSDGAGHVAVVEQIDKDGSIWISESGYKSFYFRIRKLHKPYNNGSYKFVGFIYPNNIKLPEEVKEVKEEEISKEKQGIKVVIRKGDTLWKLAEKYLGDGRRYPEIMDYNNMTTTLIREGMTIRIPGV